MKDLTNGELDKVLKFAEEIGDDSLKNCLGRLDWPHHEIEAEVFVDFAPKSFYFVVNVLSLCKKEILVLI